MSARFVTDQDPTPAHSLKALHRSIDHKGEPVGQGDGSCSQPDLEATERTGRSLTSIDLR